MSAAEYTAENNCRRLRTRGGDNLWAEELMRKYNLDPGRSRLGSQVIRNHAGLRDAAMD